ncbi:very-long-chain 3-oxoacyl-CoA reductase-B-like [Bombina bombina]|uniref:very-long-chain 3-oxoacyl-CoA reductase-B-like n=1 Tax=Bombina bombina TaxID=8345 RepID=UPI00235AA546|nr:very-long-chain 3-oxoacyl-CoA reductase-B-like [Bombina bombina]
MSAADCAMWNQGLTLLGGLVSIYIILSQGWKLIRGLKCHVISRWWRTDLKQFGRWAVVTGATDGIGKAYAQELARRGLDIVLISRTQEKLKKVADEIKKEFGRNVKIIQVDFTKGSEIYQLIEDELKGMEIGILVNNVGMVMAGTPSRFLNAPDLSKAITNIINCNVQSVLQMTQIILPQMVERKKGVIINLSSEAGNFPYPMTTMYSASKVFVDFFSRGLDAEYKSSGITVQCVMPLFVSTDMTFKIKKNIFVKAPEDFAYEALNTVGYTHRTSGCLSHSLQSYALNMILSENLLKIVFSTKIMGKLWSKWKKDYKKS